MIRYWADGSQENSSNELVESLKKAGASKELIEEMQQDMSHQKPIILKSNIEAFEWFLDVQSFLTPQGLDMAQVQADKVLSERKTTPSMYAKLKKLGIEAALYLYESRKK